jgi:hypothetical protein
VNRRLTFLAWFVQVLAISGTAFFAYAKGVFQTVYADDASMMTSVIAVLFVGAAAWLGRQAWRADDDPVVECPGVVVPYADADFGHLAERLCVMAGFVGTAIGLSMQAKALAGGATSFTALATSLFTTSSGGTAAALIAVMTYSLEAGIRRARR